MSLVYKISEAPNFVLSTLERGIKEDDPDSCVSSGKLFGCQVRSEECIGIEFNLQSCGFLSNFKNHGDPLYEQDVFELFIAPQCLNKQKPFSYFEINVSPMGLTYQAHITNKNGTIDDLTINKSIKAKSLIYDCILSQNRQSWSGLLLLSKQELAEIFVAQGNDAMKTSFLESPWLFNITRIEYQGDRRNLYSLAPLADFFEQNEPRHFHRPEGFCTLNF